MSGHSKWNNIKHKKEKSDAAKAKIFTKIGKEMAVAIKAGGPDPNNNSKLRDLIAKAKANNVPNDNIQRTIKKFTDNANIDFEEITYEGYGPSGVAIIVETSTDNRNRTAGNVRAWFSKYGGHLGQNGCVSFMFEEKGVITIVDEDDEIEEDKIMEDSLECGADDIKCDEGEYMPSAMLSFPSDIRLRPQTLQRCPQPTLPSIARKISRIWKKCSISLMRTMM